MKFLTLQSLVQCLPAWGERPAVGVRQSFGLRWWSYRRLHAAAFAVALTLRERDIQRGEYLVLWAANTPEWVSFLFGAALRGIVVVPIDEGASCDFVERIVEKVAPVLVVHGHTQDVRGLGVPTLSLYASHHEPSRSDQASLVVPVAPDDAALILFTSGTVSVPKGVILTHRNLVAQIEAFRQWRWLVRLLPARLLVIAPLSHSQGLVLGVCVPLSIGLSVIYTHSIDPAHLIRTIRQNRITLLSTVPRVLQLLGKTLRHAPYGQSGMTLEEKLETVRRYGWFLRRHILFNETHAILGYTFWVLLVGGALLPRAEEQFWFDAGYILVQGYGLTETAAIVSVNSPFSGRLGSIGRPLADQTVQLAADGEILVRGANLTPGYFQDGSDDASVVTFADGYWHTGDLARRDARNRLYFLGRKKDLIVTGEGFNVYPQEVEAVVQQCAAVRDVAVIGLERDGHEDVHAVLLLDADADAAQIVQQANTRLEAFQRIQSWTIWRGEDFPRTNLLKVKRTALAAQLRPADAATQLEAGPLAPTLEAIRSAADRRQRLELIARYVAETSATPPSREPTQLVQDLGLSSLDVVELLTLIERKAQVTLDQAAVGQDATLADLSELIQSANHAHPPRPLPVRQPAWSANRFGDALRSLCQPLVIGSWTMLSARTVACGLEHLAVLRQPFIIAGAPHKHWLDAFAIYAALPRGLRGRTMLVTNRDFGEYFAPSPADDFGTRLQIGLTYYVGLPSLFRFAILSPFGVMREGFWEICRMIDEGWSPVMFPKGLLFWEEDAQRHDPGLALIAIQTGLPIVPAWLAGNDGLKFGLKRPRDRVVVRFGEPIAVSPAMMPADVVSIVEDRFKLLAACQHHESPF